MLLTSRVRYQRKPDAPSIPSPGQAYGYEETDDGTLRKQVGFSFEDTIMYFYMPQIMQPVC